MNNSQTNLAMPINSSIPIIDEEDAYNSLETISDVIRWASSLFKHANLYYGHGTDNALDEAAYLVLHTLGLSYDLPSVYLSGRLLRSEKETLLSVIKQRVEQRIPAAYITNEAQFAGLSFYVDERVLVPRSPLAELIGERFSPWIEEDSVHNILDLCTGSACIAIACAYAFASAEVDAIDISEEALEVAQINVENHQLSQQVNLIKSDLFKALADDVNNTAYQSKYDIIVSNPPYVDKEDMDSLPAEFIAEPELGLTAGDDGLGLVIPMLQQAKQYLSPQGIIIVEVGNSQYALADTFPDVPFYWLEFEHGGDGVFLLTAEQLHEFF